MKQRSRFFSSKNKRNRFIIAAAAVVAAAVLLALLLHRCAVQQAAEYTGGAASIPSSELLITDRYEGEKLIPKYSIAKNTLSDARFSVKNGRVLYADKNAVSGVDVSSWQGDVNWKKVKAAGMYFAMIRVGYRGQTTGSIYDDKQFEQNMKGALAAGLKVGVYFYSQAVSQQETAAEADYVLKKIAPYKVTWPVAFDWEPGDLENSPNAAVSALRTQSVTPKQVSEFTRAFCDRIKTAGYQPCYYTNKTMGYSTFDLKLLEAYPVWYAEYQNLPSFYYHFDVWQYSSKGTVDGISGRADVNLSFCKFA